MIENEKEGHSFFDALQEDKSQSDYGTFLGRLVCFYLRLIRMDEVDEEGPIVEWFREHPLKDNQLETLTQLDNCLESGFADEEDLDNAFHEAIRELFFWIERRRMLDEIRCPVQRFLMVACLRRDGNGFITVRDIPPLIAKLLYSIRAAVYMELIRRENETGVEDIDNLDGLQKYLKPLVQSPFGFLTETMHLASYIAGEASALPQITWIGKDFRSLAIHGKRVDLAQLQSLSKKLIKTCIRKFKHEVKMGMSGLQEIKWNMFDPEDDLSNCELNYSFVNDSFEKKRMRLLDQFLDNKATMEYFTRGTDRGNILWNQKNCIAWLKKCKEFLEILAVCCHINGGQPSRGTEFMTTRWKNGTDEMRGVLRAQGLIFLLGRYSKKRSQVSHDRLIPR